MAPIRGRMGHECIFSELPIMPEFFRRNGYRNRSLWQVASGGTTSRTDPMIAASTSRSITRAPPSTRRPNWWNSDNFDDVLLGQG